MLAALDRYGDGVLGGPELERRPGLLAELDRNDDDLLHVDEPPPAAQ